MYYLAARPQTVVSLTNVGTLPEVLPSWFEPTQLNVYLDPKQAIKESKARLAHEIFLLVIPDSKLDEAASAGAGLAASEQRVIKKIDPKSIQKMIVYSKAGQNLLLRLLNDDCPYPIEIVPELFSGFEKNPRKTLPTSSAETACILKPLAPIPKFKTLYGDIMGSSAQTLVNPVNCVGVMGKGLALGFKQNYPKMFQDYKTRCDSKSLKLGEPYLYKLNATRWILNFPTKGHWRSDSTLKDVERGLDYLAKHAIEWGITSLAVPPLGCGNGKLNWHDVLPLIKRYLEPLDIVVEVYAPFEDSKAAKPPAAKRPRIMDFMRPVEDNSFESAKP